MRIRSCLLLVGLLGCDSLWRSSLIPNPERCDVTPTVCTADQVCDASTGSCVSPSSPDGGAGRCGVRWQSSPASASFQSQSLLVSMGSAGDLVSIGLGDLDGNGTLDLAAVSDSGSLWSFLGAGSGAFSALTSASLSGTAGQLRLADLNGDGRADLVVSNTSARLLRTSVANPDGSFAAAMTTSVANLGRAVCVAELDRSGRPDVAVALDGSNGLAVLIGDGSGGLAAPQGIPNSRAASLLTAADFNGDGLADLAALEIGGSDFQIYLNNNAGSSYLRRSSALPNGQYGYGMVSADFDCDGHADLAMGTTGNNRIAVYFGDGQGRFAASSSVATAAEPRELVAGDLDGDGNPDIGFFDQYGDVYVLPGRGTRDFVATPQRITGPQATASLQLADVNKDGKADLVLVHQYKSVMTLLNSTP